MLIYASIACTICKQDKSSITAVGTKFIRMAGYTDLDYKKNLVIMTQLNTQPIMKFKENYRSNWKNHVFQMPHSKIPFQILSVNKKQDEAPWEDPPNTEMRL
jgi:hypothetical protein